MIFCVWERRKKKLYPAQSSHSCGSKSGHDKQIFLQFIGGWYLELNLKFVAFGGRHLLLYQGSTSWGRKKREFYVV